jgi:hypothetical protein
LVVCGVLRSTPPHSIVLYDKIFHFFIVDCEFLRSQPFVLPNASKVFVVADLSSVWFGSWWDFVVSAESCCFPAGKVIGFL